MPSPVCLTSAWHTLLQATCDADPAVAIAACEFWPAYCDCPALTPDSPMGNTITALMARVIPALMAGMVYST